MANSCFEPLRRERLFTAITASSPPVFDKPKRAKGFLPVLVTGAVGDLLVTMKVLEHLSREVREPLKLYCANPDVATFVLANGWDGGHISVETEPFPGYDYYLRLNCLAFFETGQKFSGYPTHLVPLARRWTQFMAGHATAIYNWRDIVKLHPRLDHEAAQAAMARGWTRETLPFHMLGIEPPAHPKTMDLRAGPYDWEPFITVHDGFDATQKATRSTKTWNLRHWGFTLSEFKKRHPEILIIQLGGPNSRPIPGADVDLTGKTTIMESFRILSRSKLHVDGDSGLVHAARLFGVRSVVVFGPTPAKFFGYAENVNLSPKTCGDCFWLIDKWMSKCVMNYDRPKCMDSVAPWDVLTAMEEVLSG